MKKVYAIIILLSATYASLMHSTHPRAQAIIKSLESQLSQLSINYTPSAGQGIQSTIKLLRSYDLNEAQRFEEKFKEITGQKTQERHERLLEGRTRLSESEPIIRPNVTTVPSRDRTTDISKKISSQPQIDRQEAQSKQTPLIRPQAPTGTTSTATELPIDKPAIQKDSDVQSSEPQPTPLPPVIPYTSSTPAELPKVPLKTPTVRTPSAPPTDTPPKLSTPSQKRPLPNVPEDKTVKNQLISLQKQALKNLETYVPVIKGKSLEEAQSIAPQFLKQLLLDFSRNNARIKSNTKGRASGITKKDATNALPNINGLTTALTSLQVATDIYTSIYGAEQAESLISYFNEIKQDFVTVIFDNAIECIQRIKETINDIGSLTTALTHEEIHNTQGLLIQIHEIIIQLRQLNIPYVYDYVDQEDNRVPNALTLVSESKNVFDILKNALLTIKNTFAMQSFYEEAFNLKIMQKHSYEMVALMVQEYIYTMPIQPTQKEQDELNQSIQNNLTQMTTTILQLRLTVKK